MCCLPNAACHCKRHCHHAILQPLVNCMIINLESVFFSSRKRRHMNHIAVAAACGQQHVPSRHGIREALPLRACITAAARGQRANLLIPVVQNMIDRRNVRLVKSLRPSLDSTCIAPYKILVDVFWHLCEIQLAAAGATWEYQIELRIFLMPAW